MLDSENHDLMKWAIEIVGIGRFGSTSIEQILADADSIISWFVKPHEALSGRSAPMRQQCDPCCQKSFSDKSTSGFRSVETSGSSSVVADGESGDSVVADPRNDATPDTSEKGVRDDA